jgi:hypothetical protein
MERHGPQRKGWAWQGEVRQGKDHNHNSYSYGLARYGQDWSGGARQGSW